MTQLELLSPAGGPNALNAAVRGGADAVYLGLGTLNARRNADNFTPDNLREACDYAHLRGTKVYVALNTLVLSEEVPEAIDCAEVAYAAGADALIVQDLGIAKMLSDAFPGCSVHISTQANIHDAWGVRAAALIGAERITLARELSVAEIASLSNEAANYGMQTEVFIHGALCVCYSGQCLMSSMIGARSANRGLCAQACRLPYRLIRDGAEAKVDAGEYLLSPKDLCGADVMSELVHAGVSSFKIEGRMKSPEYVYGVTRVYRDILDRITCEGGSGATSDERRKLESVFSRGFTTAYMEGERGNDMMSYKRPNNRGTFIGRIERVRDKVARVRCDHPLSAGDVVEFWTSKGRSAQTLSSTFAMNGKYAEIPLDDKSSGVRASDRVFRVRSADAAFSPDALEPKIPVSCSARVEEGELLDIGFCTDEPSHRMAEPQRSIAARLMAAADGGSFRASSKGEEVRAARSKEITIDEVCEHIGRVGQTPFSISEFDVSLTSGVGLGYSQLHRVRSEALSGLEAAILKRYSSRRPCSVDTSGIAVPREAAPVSQTAVCVLATNPECARAAKRAGASAVYVPALNYRRGQATYAGARASEASQASYPKDCILQMPSVHHESSGSSREANVGMSPWDYLMPDKPILVESWAGLIRAASEGTLPQAGIGLSVTNELDISLARSFGATQAWLSVELNVDQICRLAERSSLPLGVKISGAQELMVLEHCSLMAYGPCDQNCLECVRRTHSHALRDRKDFDFPVISDALGRTHLYNSVQMDAIQALPRLVRSGVSAFLIDATLMDVEQTAQAVGRLSSALRSISSGGNVSGKLPGATSGHMFRGVV